MIKYIFTITIVCFFLDSKSQSIDSLMAIYNSNTSDSIKISCANLASELCEEADIKQYAEKVLNITTINKTKTKFILSQEAQAYNNLGYFFSFNTKYLDAIDNYLKAISILEKNKIIDADINSSVYNNLAVIYMKLQKYNLAKINFRKSLNLDVTLGLPQQIMLDYNNLATLYSYMLLNDSSIFYYKKSLPSSLNLNNKKFAIVTLGNLSEIYFKLNNLDSSKHYMQNGYKLYTTSKTVLTNKDLYILQSVKLKLLIADKKYKEAELFLPEIEVVAKSNLYNFENFCFTLKKLYEVTGNYKQALVASDLFFKLNDSIVGQEIKNKGELKLMQTNFEIKEAVTTAITEADKQKQKQVLFVGLIVFSLVFIILLLFIKSNIQRKKTNTILSNQKIELEKLSIVASETNNAVMIANANGEINWLNKGFERLYDTNLVAITNSGEINVKKLSSNSDIEQIFNTAVTTKTSINYIGQIYNDKTKNQWIQTTLTPIYKNGEIDKVVFIDSDITQLKEAEEQITKQRNLLEIKNNHITQSIDYASKLQQAILPSNESLSNAFNNYFIYFKPKDIVSGDFYWLKKVDEFTTLFAVADCTGHGVPGAFMTIFAHNLLEQITNNNNNANPAQILNQLTIKLNESLNKGNEKITDGMELTLCAYNKQLNKITMSGAFNCLYHIRNGELTEIKGDAIIMGKPNATDLYTNKEIDILKNDSIYLFTDGYPDQKGGDNGKKFFYKPFKNMFIDNANLPMHLQQNVIDETMQKWKQAYSQIDDMCVMGIKF